VSGHPATTNATVVLHGKPTELNSDLGRKFIVDAVRAAEGLQEDDELRAKYEISPSDLKKIAENTAVIAAIRDERARRVRNGQAAREAAQQRFIKSPAIMDAIMSDQQANPRHRIEASRELRATATGGGDESPAGASELFSIVFHLGADVERLEKVITPKPTPPVIEHNDSEGVVEEQGQ